MSRCRNCRRSQLLWKLKKVIDRACLGQILIEITWPLVFSVLAMLWIWRYNNKTIMSGVEANRKYWQSCWYIRQGFLPVHRCLWMLNELCTWKFMLAETARAQTLIGIILLYGQRLMAKLEHFTKDMEACIKADHDVTVARLRWAKEASYGWPLYYILITTCSTANRSSMTDCWHSYWCIREETYRASFDKAVIPSSLL